MKFDNARSPEELESNKVQGQGLEPGFQALFLLCWCRAWGRALRLSQLAHGRQGPMTTGPTRSEGLHSCDLLSSQVVRVRACPCNVYGLRHISHDIHKLEACQTPPGF